MFGRRAKIVFLVVGMAILILMVIGLVGMRIISRGFSARDEPSATEAVVARAVRRFAVPRRSKGLVNPVYPSDQILTDARAHFADHCAVCHANDGSGSTTIGRNLYPKAPDMRLDATQSRTDGELYAIIQDGIRLTGMPAWGKAGDDNDEDSWKLVHLIRHLKGLTSEQLRDMERMNPKSLEEFEEEQQNEEFLRGGAEPANEPPKKDQSPPRKHQ